jgi:excisionase family DNA binding protein
MSDDPLIGSEQACALLGVHRATLLRWAASGRVTPVHKMPGTNGAFLFSRAEITRLARERLARRGAA